MTIVFALPRHEYASYADLYQLIYLSEFESVFIDEIDPDSDNTYVITILNGEVTGWQGAKAKIVVYDLEWRTEPNPPIPGVAEFWTADKWHAELCHCKYVPMGSHSSLRHIDERNAVYETDHWANGGDVYDAAYIGFIIGVQRRERMRQQLIERGVRLSPHGAWGGDRYHVLSTSRTYLHVHQLDYAPGIPALRMVVAAAYSLPVLTETVADVGIFGDCILQADYPYYADCVTAWIHANGQLAEMGARLHDRLCSERTFRKCIEDAL